MFSYREAVIRPGFSRYALYRLTAVCKFIKNCDLQASWIKKVLCL
ncbi:hypothetical protein HMPREF9141_1277 [Prevotella multiformis DSM 16608]|uniref:Uncharacterized protein n=1 Tax=Prevotella multiformis DSM 16608 TaxID=888743 RepID=F0F6Q5_9BACT|nr:hypothetical protein HMPREF9141_1277 [Prevotella multiformis DSM 16608]